MTNNQFVEKLYKKEDELKKIVRYHNIHNEYYIDDIIQELYIKLLTFKEINKYLTEDEPNMYIIFMILRNIIYNYYNKEKKYATESINDYSDDYDIEEYFENDKYEFILNEVYNYTRFKQFVLNDYILYYNSIRALCKDKKLKYNIVQPIIHEFKNNCIDKYNKKK